MLENLILDAISGKVTVICRKNKNGRVLLPEHIRARH